MVMVFETYVTHSFVAVFTDKDGNGLNGWTSAHGEQGFSWRPGSVSFGLAGDAGRLAIEFEVTPELALRENCQRIIRVPFGVDAEQVVVADVISDFYVPMKRGEYALTFQHGWKESQEREGELDMWCVFSFVPDADVKPDILRADADIHIPNQFLMEAELA